VRPRAQSPIAALAGVAAASPAAAQQGYRMEPPMMGWGGPVMGLLMLLVLVAVIVAAVLLVRLLWNVGHAPGHAGPTQGPDRRDEARAILDARYARGEIDRDEYLQRKADLRDAADT
jgi:putative membrane protein